MFEDRSPFALLGYLMGGLSLLNLIEELKFTVLVGKVKAWVAAWGDLVHGLTQFLFGWLNNSVFSIGEAESSAIMLISLFSAAYMRAFENNEGSLADAATNGLFVCVFFLVLSVVAFFMPQIVTLAIAAVIVVYVGLWAFVRHDWRSEAMRRELVGVFGCALIIVALSRLVIG